MVDFLFIEYETFNIVANWNGNVILLITPMAGCASQTYSIWNTMLKIHFKQCFVNCVKVISKQDIIFESIYETNINIFVSHQIIFGMFFVRPMELIRNT